LKKIIKADEEKKKVQLIDPEELFCSTILSGKKFPPC
jgi:hypothetical protein